MRERERECAGTRGRNEEIKADREVENGSETEQGKKEQRKEEIARLLVAGIHWRASAATFRKALPRIGRENNPAREHYSAMSSMHTLQARVLCPTPLGRRAREWDAVSRVRRRAHEP